MIVGALIAFEFFNYSTTDYALHDLLGDLKFMGIRWSTVLAVAFCGIDFAGIARIFTPEEGVEEPAEVWYLFGAWLLGATMNALLTWWGISLAILSNETLGNVVLDKTTLLKVVPVFVALLVWLSRLLLIGTFSIAGENLFTTSPNRPRANRPASATRVAARPKAARAASAYRQGGSGSQPSYHASQREYSGDRAANSDPESQPRPTPYIRQDRSNRR
jgi:hypothetical protein